MLNPSYLAGCADGLETLMSQLESDITSDIARRVAKCGEYSDTAQWQSAKLREAKAAMDMYERAVKSARNIAGREIRSSINDGCTEALRYDDAIYRAAGMHPQAIASSKALLDVIIAGVQKTSGVMDNLTMTTARDASHTLQSALDRAYLQVTSGAFSYDQAARQVINELGKKGYTYFNYDSGTRTSLEAASRRALLTGLNQTVATLQLTRANDMDTDLVEVTSHAGARPTHAVWQGQVYSLSGKTKGYKEFYRETDYGSGDGLCGWNCYHSFYPYIGGVSTPSFERDPAARLGKSNDQVYEESQHQRYLERRVRQSRRECSTLNAGAEGATTDELRDALKSDFAAAAIRLKRREALLKEYCAKTGRSLDSSRTVTFDFGRSVSAKAVWANRKATDLTNGSNGSTLPKGATASEAQAYIRSGAVTKQINAEKQNRHIRGSDGYKAGRSYIYGSQQTAQELVNTYHGTGTPRYTKDSEWNHKEVVESDHSIGVDVDRNTGAETTTNRFTIHYSNTGTHVVPTKRKE